jgi:hypothetical protein
MAKAIWPIATAPMHCRKTSMQYNHQVCTRYHNTPQILKRFDRYFQCPRLGANTIMHHGACSNSYGRILFAKMTISARAEHAKAQHLFIAILTQPIAETFGKLLSRPRMGATTTRLKVHLIHAIDICARYTNGG